VTTFIDSPEDKQWLLDVHLSDCQLPPFSVASFEGNADSPESITLYEVNHINSLTLTLQPDPNGNFKHNQARY